MNNTSSSPASCVVLACSGSSDVGEIVDRAARKLERLGLAQMLCLAGVGSVEKIEAATKDASVVIVLDGCAHGCGAKSLKAAGATNLLHVDISELGLEKGSAPVSEMLVNQVVDRVAILLREKLGQN